MKHPLDMISRQLVLPAYWCARRLNVGTLFKVYGNNQWLSEDELQDIQWKLLKKLLSHAYANTVYYRDRMKKESCHPEDIEALEDFALLPYLTKDDIIEDGPRMISQNIRPSDLVKDSTGGSTGKNIIFFEDRSELSHRFAAGIRSDTMAGLDLGRRYAQIWGSPIDINKSLGFRRFMDRTLLRRLFISSFNLSDRELEKAAKMIRRFKPDVLIGYPTPLVRFSQFLRDQNMGSLGIKSIISSSETLFQSQRNFIEKQFGCKIYNRYGCREFGVIASECDAHLGLHVFQDRLLVELKPIDGSEEGLSEIIVTDLHKYGMPFIRYKIGDLAIPETKRCTCGRGFRLIKTVEGRTFDLVVGIEGNFIAGTFWSLLFRSVPGIKSFKVSQDSIENIVIQLVTENGFNSGDLGVLEKRIKDKCGERIKVVFKIVEAILPGSSGKHRIVESKPAQEIFNK